MSSVGPNYCSTAVNDSSIGVVAWTGTLTNVGVPGGYPNSISVEIYTGYFTTNYIKTSGYGFSIPTGATITGISVDVNRDEDPGGSPIAATDYAVRIVKGGVIGTTDNSSSTLWPLLATTETYGSSSYLWGESWTPSDINSSGFGFALAAQTPGTDTIVEINTIQITIYYTLTNGTLSNVSSMKNISSLTL